MRGIGDKGIETRSLGNGPLSLSVARDMALTMPTTEIPKENISRERQSPNKDILVSEGVRDSTPSTKDNGVRESSDDTGSPRVRRERHGTGYDFHQYKIREQKRAAIAA